MRSILLFLIFPLAILSYFFSHISPNPIFHYALAVGLVGFSLLGLQRASMLFLIAMILIDDFPQDFTEEAIEDAGFISLYTLSISGQSLFLVLATYFTVANVGMMLLKGSASRGGRLVLVGFSPEMKVVLLLGTISVFIGLPNLLSAFRIYISDLGFFVNILLGYMIVRSVSTSAERLEFFFRSVVFALGAKLFVVLFDVLVFSSRLDLVTIKPGTDSYLMIAIIIYAVVSLQERASSQPLGVFSKIFIIAGALAYYILTAGRGRMLFGVLSLAAYMVTVKAVWWLLHVALLCVAVIAIIPFVPEQFATYMLWKLDSFGPSDRGGESALVRLVSLQNIIAQQFSTVYQLIVGTGLGGYFTSEYVPFPIILGDDAFPSSWVSADTFYRPHGSLMFILLKSGLVGFIIIYSTFLWQNVKLLLRLRSVKTGPFELRRVLLVCAPLVIPLMLVNFSSKLQLLTGAILGFVYFGEHWLWKARETKND